MVTTILTLFAATLPFQVTLGTASARIIAMLTVALWVAACIHAQRIYIARVPTILIALFFSTIALGAIVASDTHWLLRKAIFLATFFALFFVMVDTSYAQRMLRIVLISGTIAAAGALSLWSAQFILGADTIMRFWQTTLAPIFFGISMSDTLATYSSAYVNIAGTDLLRLAGTLPDPHVAALFFALLTPFALHNTIRKHGAQRIAYALSALVLIAAVGATFTRGAYIALLVTAITWYIIWILHTARRKRIVRFIAGTLLMGAIAALAWHSPLGARLASSFSTDDGSVAARLLIWDDAKMLITKHPITGVGLGNYPLAINPHAAYRDPYYAHNLFLDIAAEMGVIAALLFAGLLFAALLRSIRIQHYAHTAAIAIYSIHGLFDTALFSAHVLPLILIIIASLYAPRPTHMVQ